MIIATQSQRRRASWLEIRDQTLTAHIQDVLAHDDRVADLELSINVKGGVAHLAGEVPSEGQRGMVRRLLRRQAGLYAVWDLIRLPGQTLHMVDVGCGGKKQYVSAIGVDRVASPGVDVVADIQEGLPFSDDSVDHVFAIHVLEHVTDLLFVMGELHRILRPTGVLHVLTPDWRHVNAVADPTHCRLMDVQTFRYFCEPRSGMPPWRPLMVTASHDTVHADMQPAKDGVAASAAELALWFE